MARACLSHSTIQPLGTVPRLVVSSSLFYGRDPTGHETVSEGMDGSFVLPGQYRFVRPIGNEPTDRKMGGINRAGRAWMDRETAAH